MVSLYVILLECRLPEPWAAQRGCGVPQPYHGMHQTAPPEGDVHRRYRAGGTA